MFENLNVTRTLGHDGGVTTGKWTRILFKLSTLVAKYSWRPLIFSIQECYSTWKTSIYLSLSFRTYRTIPEISLRKSRYQFRMSSTVERAASRKILLLMQAPLASRLLVCTYAPTLSSEATRNTWIFVSKIITTLDWPTLTILRTIRVYAPCKSQMCSYSGWPYWPILGS